MKILGVPAVWVAYADMFALLSSLFLYNVNEKKPDTAGVTQAADYIITMEWPVEKSDADLDLWVVPPNGHPVFFQNRQNGCVQLDADNRGWQDSIVENTDGTIASTKMAKETVSIRCMQTGHYDVGANFYVYHTHPDRPDVQDQSDHMGIKAHMEVIRINPSVTTVFDRIITMDFPSQTINAISFDLLPNGDLKATDVPIRPITATRLSQQ